MRIFIFVAALWTGFFNVAQAATLNETDFAGGFSADQTNPTEIVGGFETVTGTAGGTTDTFLHFTSLAAGAQQLDFALSFTSPVPADPFQGAFGSIEVSQTAPPAAPTEGTEIFFLNFFGLPASQTLSFGLDNTFAGGDLYVSILNTFSTQEFSFGIDVPGNAPVPAPVPVPAAGLMLLAALGGFAALRRRKPSMLPA